MRQATAIVVATLLAMTGSSSAKGEPAPPAPRLLVVCAPGYPGTTEAAQAAMDDLAAALSAALSWPPGAFRAEYQPTAAGGLARLADPSALLAMVPIPFYLELTRQLPCQPRAIVAQSPSGRQSWSLVAKTGRVREAADLAGFELHSVAGYSERFVSRVALGEFGEIPASARIVFTDQLLSALRRAAAGDDVALLLDAGQAASLATLPFAAELETVARSRELPEGLICELSRTPSSGDSTRLVRGLLALGDTAAGAEALAGLRVQRLLPVDATALAPLGRATAGQPAP